MHYSLFNILCVISAICIPILIERIKSKAITTDYKLADLSTILSILIIYYAVGFAYYQLHTNDEFNFYFFIAIHNVLTVVLIAMVVRFAPLRASIKILRKYPVIDKKSIAYISIISFFLLTAFVTYMNVGFFSGIMMNRDEDLLKTFRAVYQRPISSVSIIVLSGLFGILGEELVCRYFAINALREKLNRLAVVVVSALIWTLMHGDVNLLHFIAGLVLGYLYYETASLSICISLHLIFNLTVSTLPFYIFYKESGEIMFSPFQYAVSLFVIQVSLYHLLQTILLRTTKINRNHI